MLINIRTSELQSNNWNSIPLALFVTILLNYILFQLLPYYIAVLNSYNSKLSNMLYYLPTSKYKYILRSFSLQDLNKKQSSISSGYEASFWESRAQTCNEIMFVTSNSWDGNMTETSHISTIGNILYTSYNIWLFIASIILLLSMVGTIIITLNKK